MARARTYSPQALDAARVLGLQIAVARRERRWTQFDLGQRAGTSEVTVRSVERGAPSVALGTYFELAAILAVPLFGTDAAGLSDLAARGRDRLALLPESVRTRPAPIDDDF